MTQEALKLALEALENHTAIKHPQQIYYRDKAITALREALTEQPAQQVADSNEKAGGYMDALLWEFIDMAAAWPNASPDPRIWNHVMVYAPKPAQRTWVDLTDEEIEASKPPLSNDAVVWELAVEWAQAQLKEKNT